MIKKITEKLYSHIPGETLYHYTTFSGLMGIVKSGVLWASDIRYMNDSAELKHAADLIQNEIGERISNGHSRHKLLNHFMDWFNHRITNGHMIFAASFRSTGNLLSQWRGYSEPGKGVSLGFNPEKIIKCAREQSFQIGKCIYDPEEQVNLVRQIIDSVESLEKKEDPVKNKTSFIHFQDRFKQIESDLLRIAALLKHPTFKEEEEWRLVSPAITDFMNAPVLFREGTSMLLPYFEFRLKTENDGPIHLDHIYLGPTANINISMNSLAMFLLKNNIHPKNGISYCQIPYRPK